MQLSATESFFKMFNKNLYGSIWEQHSFCSPLRGTNMVIRSNTKCLVWPQLMRSVIYCKQAMGWWYDGVPPVDRSIVELQMFFFLSWRVIFPAELPFWSESLCSNLISNVLTVCLNRKVCRVGGGGGSDNCHIWYSAIVLFHWLDNWHARKIDFIHLQNDSLGPLI